jgi:hypothetical protein
MPYSGLRIFEKRHSCRHIYCTFHTPEAISYGEEGQPGVTGMFLASSVVDEADAPSDVRLRRRSLHEFQPAAMLRRRAFESPFHFHNSVAFDCMA